MSTPYQYPEIETIRNSSRVAHRYRLMDTINHRFEHTPIFDTYYFYSLRKDLIKHSYRGYGITEQYTNSEECKHAEHIMGLMDETNIHKHYGHDMLRTLGHAVIYYFNLSDVATVTIYDNTPISIINLIPPIKHA